MVIQHRLLQVQYDGDAIHLHSFALKFYESVHLEQVIGLSDLVNAD